MPPDWQTQPVFTASAVNDAMQYQRIDTSLDSRLPFSPKVNHFADVNSSTLVARKKLWTLLLREFLACGAERGVAMSFPDASGDTASDKAAGQCSGKPQQ